LLIVNYKLKFWIDAQSTLELILNSEMMNNESKSSSLFRVAGVNYLIPFVLITFCFALWGFANDITNPMVAAFSKIFHMSATDGALVQMAFYGGYFVMALPAALFIRRFSYKSGALLGLALYALGSFLFFPARASGAYYPFLIAYFILTCGLSFLETSCNPYILTMGSPQTATQRLNLAQSFNPIGSLLGMYVAMNFIQARLHPMSAAERAQLPEAEFEALKQADLSVLIAPYVAIGLFIVAMIILIAFLKMPQNEAPASGETHLRDDFRKLLRSRRYVGGVVAQFFYVGAQIMCWTFIIQYGTRLFMGEGMDERGAEMLSQQYNMVAMVVFCLGRFICTFLLRYVRAEKLLAVLAVAGALLTVGVVVSQGYVGLYCLVAVSACMSLMFPTIYGIALEGLGEEAKLGAAGQIMAILGGSVLPPVQAAIIDCGTLGGYPAVNLSFLLPMVCFIIVAIYGWLIAIRRTVSN
jgi:FHS family L-fucose permease-like MFS transporter